ncbi:HupE/UreJ family protein [Aquirufa rosea]|nr:HupE/UreJ family protein [Aquirufa rosea]
MVRPKTSSILAIFCFWGLMISHSSTAHPMPNSVVNLYVYDQSIAGVAKMPLDDFATAFGVPKESINLNSPELRRYFLNHIQIITEAKPWQTHIESVRVINSNDPIVREYQELLLNFICTPVKRTSTRDFTFKYDAIIHQVITHKIMVNVVQDWQGGILGSQVQVGEIALNIPKGQYFPLVVKLQNGSWWKGFGSMVSLGMYHIAEGADHLLFLLVLLLPCMLVPNGQNWGAFASASFGIKHMVKLVTAFTLGHSITLFVGAFQWIRLPQQWVEVWIALSIMISSIHAYRPLFAKKEGWIALGFGFVHGMAFASILMDIRLSAGALAWSILGFNLGIECMQILLLTVVLPLILWLSKRSEYILFRKVVSAISFLIACFWMLERIFFFKQL